MDSELMIWQEGITMVQRIMSKFGEDTNYG